MVLLRFTFGDLLRELGIEAFYAACCIDELMLACKEGMAICANFDAKCVEWGSRASLKLGRTTGAMHVDGMVLRMDSFFHCITSL